MLIAVGGGFRRKGPVAEDWFRGADGALPAPWTAAAGWVVSNGVAVCTPAVGAAVTLVDPGLEVYTAGKADCLTKGGLPTLAQITGADAHGGSGSSQQFQGVANANSLRWALGAATSDVFYRVSGYSIRTAGVEGAVRMILLQSSGLNVSMTHASATWQQLVGVGRSKNTNALSLYACYQVGTSGYDVVRVDDFALDELVLSSLIASQPAAAANRVRVRLAAVGEHTAAGAVHALDSAATPANFVMLLRYWLTGTSRLVLVKCVGGAFTDVAGAPDGSYTAGEVLDLVRSGTSWSGYLNGVRVIAPQAITDAGIIDNTLAGMFSCDPRTQITQFLAGRS